MRRLFPVALVLALAGCQLNQFDTQLQGQTTVAGNDSPLAPVLTALPFGSFTDLDFNQNQDFKNEGVTKDEINSATLTSLTLKILSPSTQDFSFLSEVEVYAQAGDTQVLIAQKKDIGSLGLAAPNPTLTLDVTSANLASYIAAPEMTIEVKGRGHPPPEDTVIRADADISVRVKVF